MSSENKNEDQEFKKASRRKFLKQGAALACMTAAGLKAAAQGQVNRGQIV